MNLKTVGLVVLEHVAAVDVTGPAEAFARTTLGNINQSTDSGSSRHCYRVLTFGIGSEACVAECGIRIQPHLDLKDAPSLDTLFICGGSQLYNPRGCKELSKWLKHRSALTRRVVGVGTGVYELAAAGLLDGRQAAVYWRFANDLALQFPNVRVNPNALFIKDGPLYSCAGGASAIDLSLSLIEEDFGRQVALNVGRELLIHLKRSGEQKQYSEALEFQIQSCDRFADIFTWILCNLNQDLSIETLAQKACMSPRNFSRLFKAAFGKAPAAFVAGVRIAEARRRLEVPRSSIEGIANSVGFQSADAFSRAFEREVGCRPSAYRTLPRVPAGEAPTKRESKAPTRLLVHA
jgi:transcriptional regulator GlxA family with amidase domain